MCLAIPGKIVNIDGDMGDVDFGGVTRKANLSMVDAQVGDWAVVHAGFAIQLMDEEDAQETIRLWNEVLDSDTTTFNLISRIAFNWVQNPTPAERCPQGDRLRCP